MNRLDLSWCLGSGGKPRFADLSISWDSISPSTRLQRFKSCFVDSRLFTVFQDVQHIVGLINEHFSQNTKFHGEELQESITSIQSRLLLLKDILMDPTDECTCLALLAFMTTTNRIAGRKVPYRDLKRRLRNTYQKVWERRLEMRDLMLWVLLICSISVLEDDPIWLADRWCELGGPEATWDRTRRTLQSILWIGFLHDDLGKEAFLKLTSQS